MRSVDEIVLDLARFTDEQRSLAWSPMPLCEATGPYDCRIGGNCGLDFNRGTCRARWAQARHRWIKEERERRDFIWDEEQSDSGANGSASGD
jgi:hypothetical protein